MKRKSPSTAAYAMPDDADAGHVVTSFYEAARSGRIVQLSGAREMGDRLDPRDPGAIHCFDFGDMKGQWADLPTMERLYENFLARREPVSLPYPDVHFVQRCSVEQVFNVVRVSQDGAKVASVFHSFHVPTGMWLRLPFWAEYQTGDPRTFDGNVVLSMHYYNPSARISAQHAAEFVDLALYQFNLIVCGAEIVNGQNIEKRDRSEGDVPSRAATAGRSGTSRSSIPRPITIDPVQMHRPSSSAAGHPTGVTQKPHDRRRHLRHRRDEAGEIVKSWWCPTDPASVIKVHGGSRAAQIYAIKAR